MGEPVPLKLTVRSVLRDTFKEQFKQNVKNQTFHLSLPGCDIVVNVAGCITLALISHELCLEADWNEY